MMKWHFGLSGKHRSRPPLIPEENWTVAGSGNLRGREWISRAKTDGLDRAVDLAWIEGFFSGVSLGENFTFLANEHDLTNTIKWMDKRLASNPDEKVSQAVAQLAAQMLDRGRSNPW